MRKFNDHDHSPREGLSVDEACHVAGVGKTMMYEVIRSGALPAHKLGRRIIILRSDLATWMASLPRFVPGSV